MTSLPPGPKAESVPAELGAQQSLRALLRRCHRRFGDIFTLPVSGQHTYVCVCDPADVKRVFTADPSLLMAGAAQASALEPIVGPRSLILLDGEEHLEQRRLMLPPFHGERVARYGELIAAIADAELDRWPLGEPLDLRARMQAMTLEVITRVVFGVRGAQRVARMRDGLARLWTVGTAPPGELPGMSTTTGPREELDRTRAQVDRLIDEEVALRREEHADGERDDVLSLLLAARGQDGPALSPPELRDQLVTLLVAGHETTAAGLASAWDRLCRNPATMERLVRESRDGEGDAYAEAVVREVLRLRPPLPMVGRLLTAPWELHGHLLPAGAIVAPCIHLLHRRPDLYPEPGEFRPERFLGTVPDTYAWIPFGGGRRRCLGAPFALLEMRVILRTVARRARLRAASAEGKDGRAGVVLVEREPAGAPL